MLRYVIERLVAMLVTLAIIVTIGFMVIRLMPGNMFEGNPDMTAEQQAALEAKYHLDKPLPVQYGYFLRDAFTKGDWGTSLKLYPNVPVWDIMKTRIFLRLSWVLSPLYTTLHLQAFSSFIPLPCPFLPLPWAQLPGLHGI